MSKCFLTLLCLVALPSFGYDFDLSGWRIEEATRFHATEARQGVAVDDRYLYVIGNNTIGKYDKHSFEPLARWSGADAGPIIHFNAGVVFEDQLLLAHSNYPDVPMTGSVEIYDPETLEPIDSQSFGVYFGLVTWVLPFEDGYLVCFAHYANRAAEPNRDPTWTSLVHFDRQWRRIGGWVFPKALFAHIGGAYTLSGGAFGPESLLYVSGHDAPELHLLRFPIRVRRWSGSVAFPCLPKARPLRGILSSRIAFTASASATGK